MTRKRLIGGIAAIGLGLIALVAGGYFIVAAQQTLTIVTHDSRMALVELEQPGARARLLGMASTFTSVGWLGVVLGGLSILAGIVILATAKTTPPPRAVPAAPQSGGRAFCPGCGTPVEGSSRFCGSCGASV